MKPTDRQRELFKSNFNFLVLDNLEETPTQEDLADLLGVSQTSISSWLVGQKFPRASTLDKIAKLYDVTVNELVNVDMSQVLLDTWLDETREQYNDNVKAILSDIQKAKDSNDRNALADGLEEFFEYVTQAENYYPGIVKDLDYSMFFSEYFPFLNQTGKRKAVEYIRDLFSIPRYRKGNNEHKET